MGDGVGVSDTVAVLVGVIVSEGATVGVVEGVALPSWVHEGVDVLLGEADGVEVQLWVEVGEGVMDGAAVPLKVGLGEGRRVFVMVAVAGGGMVADGLCVGSGAPLAADAALMWDRPSEKWESRSHDHGERINPARIKTQAGRRIRRK